MTSRNQAFSSDPESSSVLKSLGYSEEEISGTPGEATPDDLRTSLRQLSAAHSSDVQREHMPSTPPNPKFAKDAAVPPNSDEYWQGRKDEATSRKSNMNPGSGFRPPRPRAQPSGERQRKQTMKQIGRIMKTFGSGGSAAKGLSGVTRAQRGRRGR